MTTKLHHAPLALVAGLGASGRAAIEWLAARGWRVRAADTREAPSGLEALRAAHPEAEIRTGGLPVSLLDGVSMLVMSPGLSTVTGAAAPLVAAARESGVEVVGEIELFARELARLRDEKGYAPKVLGITGTNGKTTTTVLTTRMCAHAGLRAVAAGNIGPNAVTELLKAEAADELPDVWVLELSSFQLDTTTSLRLTAGALLNITEDHVDWHGSMDAYAAAKAKIFTPGAVAVVNRDDAGALRRAECATGPIRTFGAEAPKAPGDAGLVDAPGGAVLVCGDAVIAPERDLLIAGRHNAMNAMAAWLLAGAAGAPEAARRESLLTYRGEAHRVERVFTHEGVDVVDDSKGTNVGAVEAAVKGFAAQGRRLLIILGGDGKGQDFSPLAAALKARTGGVALIGRDAPAIEAALGDVGAEKRRFGTLEEAVAWLWSLKRPGDVLLLSPACASWDMFRDYAHRSRVFIEAAKKLAGLPLKEVR